MGCACSTPKRTRSRPRVLIVDDPAAPEPSSHTPTPKSSVVLRDGSLSATPLVPSGFTVLSSITSSTSKCRPVDADPFTNLALPSNALSRTFSSSSRTASSGTNSRHFTFATNPLLSPSTPRDGHDDEQSSSNMFDMAMLPEQAVEGPPDDDA